MREKRNQLRTQFAEVTSKQAAADGEWKTRYATLEGERNKLRGRVEELHAESGELKKEYDQLDTRWRVAQRRCDEWIIRSQKEQWGDIERIEGIGPSCGQKLRGVGIFWMKELLQQGAGLAGRARISEESTLDPEWILKWVNMADLLRIPGITPAWAELLEESGVDTVKEIRNRVPENLHAKMTEVNATGNFAGEVPSLDVVRGWIQTAKGMEPLVS